MDKLLPPVETKGKKIIGGSSFIVNLDHSNGYGSQATEANDPEY